MRKSLRKEVEKRQGFKSRVDGAGERQSLNELPWNKKLGTSLGSSSSGVASAAEIGALFMQKLEASGLSTGDVHITLLPYNLDGSIYGNQFSDGPLYVVFLEHKGKPSVFYMLTRPAPPSTRRAPPSIWPRTGVWTRRKHRDPRAECILELFIKLASGSTLRDARGHIGYPGALANGTGSTGGRRSGIRGATRATSRGCRWLSSRRSVVNKIPITWSLAMAAHLWLGNGRWWETPPSAVRIGKVRPTWTRC